jgi:hypothetical protein
LETWLSTDYTALYPRRQNPSLHFISTYNPSMCCRNCNYKDSVSKIPIK